MSDALQARAEIVKLARLLGRSPATLEYLATVPAADIRELRERVTDRLFSADAGTLGKLAAASRLLPVGLVAMLGERVFGPVLSAHVAGLLDPDRAMEMAAKLPVSFLAEVAVHIDPRRASAVIARVPPRQVAEITAELAGHDEYVAMGRFVSYLPNKAIEAALAAVDDEGVLRVAFVLERKEALHEFASLLPEARIDGIIDAAARANLWAEALDLLDHLNAEQRVEFARRTDSRDDAVVRSLVRAARELDMWGPLLPLVAELEPRAQERVGAIVRQLDLDAVERRRVLDYVHAEGLEDRLGQLTAALASDN